MHLTNALSLWRFDVHSCSKKCLFFYFSQEMYDNGELVLIPHAKFGFILLVVLALSLLVFGAARFKLNKYLGATFVVFYIMFVAYAYIQDLYCNGSC